MVSHRLSTVMRCDKIIEIRDGVLFQEGDPSLIINNLS